MSVRAREIAKGTDATRRFLLLVATLPPLLSYLAKRSRKKSALRA